MVGHQVLLSVPAVEILGTEGDPSTGVSLRLWWIVQPSFDRTRGCQIPIVRSLVQEFCLKGGFRFDRGHVLALHGALQSSSCDHALQLCESGGSATELSVTDAWGGASAGDAISMDITRTNSEWEWINPATARCKSGHSMELRPAPNLVEGERRSGCRDPRQSNPGCGPSRFRRGVLRKGGSSID
jgi:hypothetical protein